MFEASVEKAELWKKIVEALKELVQEANFQCTPEGVSIQAMDTAHVALSALMLRGTGFQDYGCERSTVLGINLASLSKILKTIDNNEQLILKHEDESDVLGVIATGATRQSEYNLKLMDIEADTLGIPDIEYIASVELSSSEFTKICKDMSVFGDTITVQVSKLGVKFSAQSDFCDGFVFLKSSGSPAAASETVKSEGAVKAEKVEDDEDEVKAEVKAEAKTETTVKQEVVSDDDDDANLVDKLAPQIKKEKVEKKKKDDGDNTEKGVNVTVGTPVTLSFALRYFNTFAKGGSLADRVVLKFAEEQPCMVEFKLSGLGFLRFYLAPKVEGNDN